MHTGRRLAWEITETLKLIEGKADEQDKQYFSQTYSLTGLSYRDAHKLLSSDNQKSHCTSQQQISKKYNYWRQYCGFSNKITNVFRT